jgi:hypothetical protein
LLCGVAAAVMKESTCGCGEGASGELATVHRVSTSFSSSALDTPDIPRSTEMRTIAVSKRCDNPLASDRVVDRRERVLWQSCYVRCVAACIPVWSQAGKEGLPRGAAVHLLCCRWYSRPDYTPRKIEATASTCRIPRAILPFPPRPL